MKIYWILILETFLCPLDRIIDLSFRMDFKYSKIIKVAIYCESNETNELGRVSIKERTVLEIIHDNRKYSYLGN